MRARAVLVVALALRTIAGAQEPTLAELLAKTDRAAAVRIVAVAGRADRRRQGSTAVRLYERAVQLDPENVAALTKLGYRSGPEGWTRAPEAQTEVFGRRDADPEKAAAFRDEAAKVEEWRAREIAKVCAKRATAEEARPLLLGLLRRTPRVAEVHRALGHPRVGNSHVRPELEQIVAAMPGRLAAWRACAEDSEPAEPVGRTLRVPGLKGGWPVYRIGGREVTAAWKEDWPVKFTLATEPPHRLMRLLLGPEAKQWFCSPVIFVSPENFEAIVGRHHEKASERKDPLRTGWLYRPAYVVVRTNSWPDAIDYYAHTVSFYTMQDLVAPPSRENPKEREYQAYSWMREGYGFLATLELFGTVYSYFYSTTESTGKVRYTLPPPKEKKREPCLAWLRAQLEDGLGLTLHELCGRSLNNLDFFGSMQAYTFVRFLFLLDPDAARRLPAALASQEEGGNAERADRALRATFGKGLADLEPLWLAFTLEIRE